jgi:hypothetical protein
MRLQIFVDFIRQRYFKQPNKKIGLIKEMVNLRILNYIQKKEDEKTFEKRAFFKIYLYY